MTKENQRNGRDNCYICGGGHAEVLETHHIVPRRHGGTDESLNLVDLCPTCHVALERLYDKRFYDEVTNTIKDRFDEQSDDECEEHVCEYSQCSSKDTKILKTPQGVEKPICDGHRECNHREDGEDCGRKRVTPVMGWSTPWLVTICEEHLVCDHDGCRSTDVFLEEVEYMFYSKKKLLCSEHVREAGVSDE